MTSQLETLWDRFAPIAKKLNLREETVSGVDEIGMITNFIKAELSSSATKIREEERARVADELYDLLPSGNVDAFRLVTLIGEYIEKLRLPSEGESNPTHHE